MSGKIDKMSDVAAAVVMQNFSETDPEKLKQEITKQLDSMLANGEISKEDYKAGIKLTNKNSIMSALAGRNKTEGNIVDWVRGFEDLENPEADTLMKAVGLDISTIGGIAADIAKGDYTVHDKDLKQIQAALNAEIKSKGIDYELSKKETKLLVESVGINVKSMNILKRIFGTSEKRTEESMNKLAAKAEKGIEEYAEKHANDKVLTVMNEDLDKTIQKYEAQGLKVIKEEENVLYTVIRITSHKAEEE